MPITLTDDTLAANTFSSGGVNLFSNDTIDPADYTLSVDGISVAVVGGTTIYGSFGELVLGHTGVASYRPYAFMRDDHQLNLGETLTDSFTYEVSGDGFTDTATLTIDLTSGFGLHPYDTTVDTAIIGGTRTTFWDLSNGPAEIMATRDVRAADTDVYTFIDSANNPFPYSSWVQEVDDNGQIVSNVMTLDNGDTVTYTYDYAGTEDYHTSAVHMSGATHLYTIESLETGDTRTITDVTGGPGQDHTFAETVNGSGDTLIERSDFVDGTYFEERWDFTGARIYEAQSFLPADSIIAEQIDEFMWGTYLTDRAITFQDGDMLTYNFDAGGAGTVTGIRNSGEANQYSYNAVLNADGSTRDETFDFDNGREVVNTYANGLISTRAVTDPGAISDYATLNIWYDTNGNKMTWNADMDNGDIVRKQYVDGVLSMNYREDISDSRSWTSYQDRYDTNTGDLSGRVIVFDDGVRMNMTINPDGRFTNRTDLTDSFDWDSRRLEHNAAGDMTLRSIAYDDGSSFAVRFHDNGAVSARTVGYAPGDGDLALRTTYFGEDGIRSGVDFINADYSMRGVRFDTEGRIDERITSYFEDGTAYFRSVEYDDFGNRTTRVEREMTGPEGIERTWTYDTDGNVLDFVVEDIAFPMF